MIGSIRENRAIRELTFSVDAGKWTMWPTISLQSQLLTAFSGCETSFFWTHSTYGSKSVAAKA